MYILEELLQTIYSKTKEKETERGKGSSPEQ
jgi:hypothetical protein